MDQTIIAAPPASFEKASLVYRYVGTDYMAADFPAMQITLGPVPVSILYTSGWALVTKLSN